MPEYCAECHTTIRENTRTGKVIHDPGCRYRPAPPPETTVALTHNHGKIVGCPACAGGL